MSTEFGNFPCIADLAALALQASYATETFHLKRSDIGNN